MVNSEVFEELCEWATEKLNSDELNNILLLGKDDREHMLLHDASVLEIIQILEGLWNWAKEQQTPEELNNIYRQTAWHMAAEKGKLEVLDKLWEWANKDLMPKEF
jgi:hypothetical protein